MAKRKQAPKRLTRRIEDYLGAIYLLGLELRTVRVRDVARALSVSMPSVTGMLAKLKQQGLVSHERYESVSLTKQGVERGEQVYRRYQGLKEFLESVLGRMKHAVSEETLSRLTKLTKYIGGCSQGREHWVRSFHTYLRTGKLERPDCRERECDSLEGMENVRACGVNTACSKQAGYRC
jgi:DtxR family Mn-dependent transcriptional regulator